MPFNGSGTFTRLRNWVADATAGIKIRADFHDSEDDNIAEGLSDCIVKDGQTTITQNIPFNGKRIINLQDPVNDQDAATKAYVEAQVGTSLPGTGGTITGDLIIDKDSPALILDATLGTAAALVGKKEGILRWVINLGDGSAETGGDEGSDFFLAAYDDLGILIEAGYPLMFDRKTGLGRVLGPPVEDFGIVNKKYADDAYQAKDPQLYAGVPQNKPTFPYTLVATDAQKHIYGAGAVTIPSNASVPFIIGTCISFVPTHTAGMTIAIASDTLDWYNGSALVGGTRTIAPGGVATALKIDTTRWVISGNGMT